MANCIAGYVYEVQSELKQNEMMVLAQGGRPELEEESKYICRAKN